MSSKHIINKPTKNQDIVYEELYEKIDQTWEDRAKALQDRRWRAIKNETRHQSSFDR